MKKRSNKATLGWIKNAIPSSTKWTVCFLAVLGIFISVLSTYSAVLIKGIIDSAVVNGSDIVLRLSLYGAYIVALLLFEIAFSLISVRTTARAEIKLRRLTMANVVDKDYKAITAYHSGDVMNRATSDVGALSSAITQVVPGFCSVMARVVSAFVILFVTDYKLALIVFATAPVTLIASRFYGKRIKGLHHTAQKIESKNRSFMTEIVQNMTVIRAFRSQKPVFEHYDDLQEENFDMKMRINRFSVLANVLMFVSVSLVYFFTIAWGVNKIIVDGVLAFGALTATLQLVTQFQSPLKSLAGLTNQYYRALASAERIMELDGLAQASAEEVKSGGENFSALVAKNVAFSYDGESEVIKNLTFEVKRGEVAVVSGPSGAGKSTLLKLVMGLFAPTDGSIVLEGASEPEDKTVFSYVPQGNMILSGTIRDNVTFFNSAISDEKINEVLDLCCLDKVVASLPNGIDSVIGERGTGLSEGQIQRLSIARALLMNKKILLLDEATSALDAETESKVLDNLVSRNYTVLLVTHNKAVKERYNKQIIIN